MADKPLKLRKVEDREGLVWWRAFRTHPRRMYDLVKVDLAARYEATITEFQPGGGQVKRGERHFPFQDRGAKDAAIQWLTRDGSEPGIVRRQPAEVVAR